MYGYGFSRSWQDLYEPPRLDCGLKDFDKIRKEFHFLENPDPGTAKSVLTYYTTEFNREMKRNLYCIVSSI
jgi:hypothetical protein